MAIALAQTAQIQHSTANLAYATNPTAGNCLIVITTGTSQNITVGDSQGQTWRTACRAGAGTNSNAAIFYCYNCLGGATTVQFTSGGGGEIAILEFSGVHKTSNPLNMGKADYSEPCPSRMAAGAALTRRHYTPTTQSTISLGLTTGSARGVASAPPSQ